MKNKFIIKSISLTLACATLVYSAPVFAFVKNETVYSNSNSDGSIYKTIVSTHLENSENQEILEDLTNLINIKNTNGDEEYTKDGNKIVWQSHGKDIYYKGETDKELPIECEIIYELNGDKVTAEEIAGKSGKVKITFNYKNKDEHIVNINGKNEKMYTPFVVAIGTIFDNTKNTNINVSSGKLINDGTKTILLGIAFPGLEESLKLSKNDINIPSNIEITMDATEFEQKNIITCITPKLLDKEGKDIFDKIDNVYSKVNLLEESSNKIEEGANALEDASTLYTEKLSEFGSGMDNLTQGINEISTNYETLDAGIKQISEVASLLSNGMEELFAGVTVTSESLKQISSGIVGLQEGRENLQNASQALKPKIDQMTAILNQINFPDNTEKIEELQKLIEGNKQTIKVMESNIELLKMQKAKETDENVLEAIEKQIIADEAVIKGMQNSNIEETLKTLQVTDAKSMKTLIDNLKTLSTNLVTFESGIESFEKGLDATLIGINTLAEKSQSLPIAVKTMNEGMKGLKGGTLELSNGSNKIKIGLNGANSGITKLNNANKALTSGANSLNAGIAELSNGITTFNKEGIQEITTLVNTKIKGLSKRAEKLMDLSDSYNNFTGIENGNQSNVKFIVITDDINKDTEAKEKAILDEKEENK